MVKQAKMTNRKRFVIFYCAIDDSYSMIESVRNQIQERGDKKNGK